MAKKTPPQDKKKPGMPGEQDHATADYQMPGDFGEKSRYKAPGDKA